MPRPNSAGHRRAFWWHALSPGAEMLAKSIIAIATQGERDPNRLRERAIERICGTAGGTMLYSKR